MAPKAPPKPPPPKNVFERFGDYLDSDQGKQRTKILVVLFFLLAVLMSYLYKVEVNKGEGLKKAVASIRQFAVDYDPSLLDKTDLEVLAAVHHFTLKLLNWTLKNEELEQELKILIEMVPAWHAFEKNLYYFSNERKTWKEARQDCLTRHTADLVSCRYGEEQGFIDNMALKKNRDYWVGLYKNASVRGGLLWLNGLVAGTLYWSGGQPDGGDKENCIVTVPPCSIKNCWHDAPCAEKRYFCCKMRPNDIWFY
ncbi:C-type lectin domain family 4 member K-like [Crotalus tigris]|uniref:C-type lectin domain family 4 member K-like n=1 Tax=Crotalus tigris TaxID=88082 RepID=UPI00192F8709|nr:C-type lectin domain family 4 member K-like [Crotalus tigris]